MSTFKRLSRQISRFTKSSQTSCCRQGRRLPPRTRTHTHPYEDTYANPTLMKTSDRHLAIDGDVVYYWKHSTVKSYNKFRKMRAPVSSRGLEPRWAGSTTKNPISRATLSSQQCQYTWSQYITVNLFQKISQTSYLFKLCTEFKQILLAKVWTIEIKRVFSSYPKKFNPITSNIWTHAWSTKYRRKKLIAQFGWKPWDESFKPN
jgi:hypothetical protein